MKVEEALEIGGRLISAVETDQEPSPADAIRLAVGVAVNLARIAQASEETVERVDSIDTVLEVRRSAEEQGGS